MAMCLTIGLVYADGEIFMELVCILSSPHGCVCFAVARIPIVPCVLFRPYSGFPGSYVNYTRGCIWKITLCSVYRLQ